MVALRLATHDSGSGWFATPFLYDSFIHNSTPVYPGALRSLLDRAEDWKAIFGTIRGAQFFYARSSALVGSDKDRYVS
jgi:hypothetical protein